jgi:clan AA aspartic protease (TIGR02281 family)
MDHYSFRRLSRPLIGSIVFAFAALLFLYTPGSGLADVYSWTEDDGTLHVTDAMEKIPSIYRSRAVFLSRSPEDAAAAPVVPQTDYVISFEKNPSRAIFVDVVLNDTMRAKMILDTGAGLVVLSEDLAKRLNLPSHEEAKTMLLHTAGGDVTGRAVRLSKVQLGPAVKENVHAVVNMAPQAFKGFDGLLGMSFLQDFKMVIDYTNHQVHLQKNCIAGLCEEP